MLADPRPMSRVTTASAPGTVAPVRVTVVIDSLDTGGAERLVAEEASAFDPSRVRLSVVVLGGTSETPFASQVRASGVPVFWVRGRGLLDMHRFVALTRLLRQLQPDVVHAHTDYSVVLALLAATLRGIPCVVTLHGLSVYQSRWKRAKQLLLVAVLCTRAERIIAVARGAVPAIVAQFHLPVERVVTIPNAVSPSSFCPPVSFNRAAKRTALGLPLDVPVVTTVGRLVPVKGHALLLEAAKEGATPLAHFVVVGGGSERARLEDMARRLDLSDRFHFLGERGDVTEILAASDIFVLPSLSEAMPQALLEAMAAGLPCVATDVGGIRDVLISGQTGWLVPPADPRALGDALRSALADRKEAQARAAAGQARVNAYYGMDTRLNRLEALYREVSRSAQGQVQQCTRAA